MKTYKQVLETVELALAKGEYNYCIEFLLPIIESFPLSSKEGVNLRTILITALCGINKKEEAKSCLLYTSPSPRDLSTSRMPSSA